ncbi:ribokinase [Ferrimonas sediminicola]|uniref:Ribokinase n=1 Tax=Ferrimonas sediminicola TaxID=2569538 RepID=A0A4U1BB63_9GAMM|nr:ribokinase [Ferrimonas sediminicola]TKB48127.1 ribokinase [Ferrimonas sediminicola]
MAKLTVLGSINVDHLLQVAQFPRPGQTLEAENYQTIPGGKGANQAVAAARLGARVAMVGCIGDDPIGQTMKQGFEADGIDTSAIDSVPGEATGLAMIYVNAQGENNIGIWPGANGALGSDRVAAHRQAIEQADLLLIQLETPTESLIEAAKLAKAAGTRVVLNPAPAKALPDALLRHVDIITPNETEAEQLTGIAVANDEAAAKAAECLHQKFGIEMVIITLGKRGVWLSHLGAQRLVPGFRVSAIDTTAAGDTFNGGFVTALLEGQSVDDAIRFGQAAAALSVTRLGAQSSIPTREETLALIASQG